MNEQKLFEKTQMYNQTLLIEKKIKTKTMFVFS